MDLEGPVNGSLLALLSMGVGLLIPISSMTLELSASLSQVPQVLVTISSTCTFSSEDDDDDDDNDDGCKEDGGGDLDGGRERGIETSEKAMTAFTSSMLTPNPCISLIMLSILSTSLPYRPPAPFSRERTPMYMPDWPTGNTLGPENAEEEEEEEEKEEEEEEEEEKEEEEEEEE